MSFLNPLMLLGLGAVSVPIIIHLLNRRRFQKVVWGAMWFLKVSVEQNQRRMRIEDLILLLLRCLLLALLALALARPAILSSGADVFGQSKVTAVVVLDNSYSMGVSDGTRTRFDKAREVAEEAVDSMPAGSATALLLASDVVHGAIPEPTFDLNLARKMIREAPLTDRTTDLYPAVRAAVDTLKDRLVIRKEIYVVTDGQAGGWLQLEPLRRLLQDYRNEIAIHLILIRDGQTANLGVSELRLAGGLSPVDQPIRFEVKVTNFGREEVRDTRVSLSLDSDPPGDEFTIESLPPGASRSVSLFTKLRQAGYHSVTARVPEDRLHADDHRTLAVRAIREVRVLLVDGERGGDARDAETYFLRHALVPVPRDYVGSYFIQTESIASAELGQARLEDYDALVLANVPDFSDVSLSNLKSYLRRGGGLIVFPGSRVNRAFYNERLFKESKILPAALGALLGEPEQETVFVTFQTKDYEHPVVDLWNDPGSGTLASARFFRRYALEPDASETVKAPENGASTEPARAQDAGRVRTILLYSDGSSAVLERNWGLGRVVLYSSTADTEWNDLPVRLSFVPLIHRTLGRILQRQDEGLNVRVGGRFARRVPMEFLDREATYFKPRQTDAVRDLRRIELSEGWPVLSYDQTDFAGLYEVSVVEPELNLKFAAQPDSHESNLEEMSPAQMATLKEAADVIDWEPEMSLRGMVQQRRSGMEFWLPMALAALLVAVAETFLGQWFSRSK